jgi:hypothetical protein
VLLANRASDVARPVAPGDAVNGRWRTADMKYRCTSLGESGTVAWAAVRRSSVRDRRRRRVRTRTHTVPNTPTCGARCRLDARHRLAAGGRVPRASPCLRAAGATVRPSDVGPGDARRLSHPFDSHCQTIRSRETHDEVSLACAGRSGGCHAQRRLGRVRPHLAGAVGVSSGARPGHGGEPA